MIRKKLKNLNKIEKIINLAKKFKIPVEFISTNHIYILRGLMLGIFVAMIPMPMQMGFILFLMTFLRFNVPLALLLCWITNPLTMPIIYFTEYKIGAFLLNIKIDTFDSSLEWIFDNLGSIFIPLYTGALVLSLTLSISSYFILKYIWYKSAIRERRSN